jgi:hypothetical protein
MQSPLWHWELNEQTAVAPGAALGRQAERHIPLALWGMPERPSLSWQSQRHLLPLQVPPPGPLQLLSPGPGPVPQLAGHRCKIKANGEDGWQLWRCAAIP